MADKFHIAGVTGGEVQNSNVAGIVHGNMGNTTNTRHGDRSVRARDIGNVATGDDHLGSMSTVMGAGKQTKGIEDVTENDVVTILKERKLGKYETLFREQGIDGSLLLKLTDDRLSRFGVTDDWDRERLLNLKKYLPK